MSNTKKRKKPLGGAMMQDEGHEGDRTPGETVHGMPVDGTERIRPLLATLGIPWLPGLPEV